MLSDREKRLGFGLLISSLVGAGLFAACAIANRSLRYDYLLVNLALAWIPLLISTWLVHILKNKPWSSWGAMGVSIVWLIFLPNSFYMITDFIHLSTAPGSSEIYYAITFTSIIYTAVVIGLLSLYTIHVQLAKRLKGLVVTSLLALILVICSIGIYAGRDLRLNSWDILTNPGGLLFDISDRLTHISAYPTILETSGIFFALLAGMYFLAWSGTELIKQQRI